MSKKVYTVQNLQDVEQSIFLDGQRYTLEPHAVQQLPEPIAREFLDKRARYVTEYTTHEIPSEPGDTFVWVANMTGNPLAPPTVEIKKRVKRADGGFTDMVEEVINPICEPQLIKEQHSGGQRIQKAPNGYDDECLNLLPSWVSIAPYTVRYMPRRIAEWLVLRDSRAPLLRQRRVMICREPPLFKPTQDWSLEDIQAYVKIVDPKEIGTREDLLGGNESDYEDEASLITAKQKLLNALFFRLVDDRWGLPLEADFRAMKPRTKVPAARLPTPIAEEETVGAPAQVGKKPMSDKQRAHLAKMHEARRAKAAQRAAARG